MTLQNKRTLTALKCSSCDYLVDLFGNGDENLMYMRTEEEALMLMGAELGARLVRLQKDEYLTVTFETKRKEM